MFDRICEILYFTQYWFIEQGRESCYPMEKKGYITIKDIARVLGFSVSTVSRALRDMPDVHPETRAIVQKQAQEMNYQRNLFASALVHRRTRLLGVIVPKIANNFFSEIISGIQEVAYRNHYQVIICESRHDMERERLDVEGLLSIRVDGLLIIPAIEKPDPYLPHLHQARDRDLPMVYLDRLYERLAAPTVMIDDFKSAFEATEYLISTGCTRLGLLAGPDYLSVSRLRREGFEAALRKHNLPVNESWMVETNFEIESGVRAAEILFSQPQHPDALLGVNDAVIVGAMKVIRRYRYHVPNDISLIGFSDNPIASLIQPELTTIAQPAFDMGRTAADILLEMIEHGESVAVDRRVILKTTLIIRNSTRTILR
ncbi:MAG: LacI family DNA-binding transcriptional regulator [Bacteroidetes bacterium]|nr:MAG: LacI family DNA-binding transcriptional regulator [Bacteroidota bacterium]